MNTGLSLQDLINEIAECLASESANDLNKICSNYGLEDGDISEAFKSKRSYIKRRLKGKDKGWILSLAKRIVEDYGGNANKLNDLLDAQDFFISEITKKEILKTLYSLGKIEGELEVIEFLKRIWDLNKRDNHWIDYDEEQEIWNNRVQNNNWDDRYLYEVHLKILNEPMFIFKKFIEQVVHPTVRKNENQETYIKNLNKNLIKDGYKFINESSISGFNIFKIAKVSMIEEFNAKNLIFASIKEKPDIVLKDAIQNELEAINDNVLIYNQAIQSSGLLWKELVGWWGGNRKNFTYKLPEHDLYKRLEQSLDSEPENILFYQYYKVFSKRLINKLPALIPQVYLHYDPKTLRQRKNEKVLKRQRVDFLMLLPNGVKVVLEIDGKHHYSEGDKSSPKLYAEMMELDRELKLTGYEVFRFGGYEFFNNKEDVFKMIEDFFNNLFSYYEVEDGIQN
ncbi:DUF559 domain-containing protein [Lysinibacillus capsici]|uniref:AbiJ-related protein n=1 Tax=Lysinibacillus capsici TaxID=2115968 RepID=UPI0034E4075E